MIKVCEAYKTRRSVNLLEPPKLGNVPSGPECFNLFSASVLRTNISSYLKTQDEHFPILEPHDLRIDVSEQN